MAEVGHPYRLNSRTADMHVGGLPVDCKSMAAAMDVTLYIQCV